MSKVLLVGNDINNINNPTTWAQLLKEIIAFCGVTHLVNNIQTKPFPLLYEEIFLKSLAEKDWKENELKTFIAKEVSLIGFNEIHQRIMAMDCEHLLTTNYEYTLEKAAGHPLRKLKNQGVIREKKFNLFRNHQAGKTAIWHIHGECRSPQTITLGFEHYGGALQHMRNYVISGTQYLKSTLDPAPLVKRFNYQPLKNDSWIDLFFTKDIHILGLAMDFVETDLWWLLTFRARYLIYYKKPLKNRIFYFIPSEFEKSSLAKLELFKANGVEVVSLRAKKKLDYYHKVLDWINK